MYHLSLGEGSKVQRSRSQVKVVYVFPLYICFRMITPVWIDPLYLNFTYVSLITHGRPLLILGSKVKRTRSEVRIVLHALKIFFQKRTPVRIGQLYSNFTSVSLITQERPLLLLGSKGQQSRSHVRVVNIRLQFNFWLITPVYIKQLF